MATKHPLKTVMSPGSVDDTSLALPSVNQFSSGQQRVKEQVQSVRRTKSRHLSSRSRYSSLPTISPSYESVFGDSLKPPSGASNGRFSFRSSFLKSLNLERNSTWQIRSSYTGSKAQRNKVAWIWFCTPGIRRGSNGPIQFAGVTMKEAVDYLSISKEVYQIFGASYIQHSAFVDDKAREEVLKLNGVPALVKLLRSPSAQVGQTASAALRNLSFKSERVKEAIHRCDGITGAVALLKETDSVATQKQLTGLLWNLSSAESLKPDLLNSALPVLVERVILPYATGYNQTSRDKQDPVIFFHATGCLRNVSSANQFNRQALRKCPGLVDSLVRYISNCVMEGKPDDKSVENSVCILHNLTFQLEAEEQILFQRIMALAKPVSRNDSQGDAGPISCFSPQNKPANHECQFDYPAVEDPLPSGAGWLFHSKTLQNYLSLLSSSQQEDTQEACCGAMCNLTTHDGIVSSVMSQTIVQKLNGLSFITPLIRSNKINLQKSIVTLLGNLTKNRNLNHTIARKALPELLAVLSAGAEEADKSDDTLAMACHTANSLLMKEPIMGKELLTGSLIDSLRELSHNTYLPKCSKAAGLLLYNLWSEKDFQSVLKKQGMSKASFVNDITTAAHRSFHVVQ